MILQSQYDLLYRYFKTTTEPYDSLEWDGNVLCVCLAGETIETYTVTELTELVPDFWPT